MNYNSTEIRIHYDQISHDMYHFDSIGIGHTGCVHKLMGISDDHIEMLLNRFNNVKVEIPIIFQSHLAKVIDKIKLWEKYPIGLIINDFGILYELKFHHLLDKFHISLGRNLVYSFFNCPWYEDILAYEDDQMKELWLESNMDNDQMIDFLQEYHIREIDMDLSMHLKGSIEKLRSKGIKINGFIENPIASISRSCHAVRVFNGKLGECQELCNQPILLEPKQRWNRFDDTLVRISKPNRDKLGTLLVYGNTIVSQRKNIDIEYTFDTLCIDLRYSTLNKEALVSM
jgi:hypothetical protein